MPVTVKQRDEAREYLREYLTPETNVLTVLAEWRQSAQGHMLRYYRLFVIRNNEPYEITHLVWRATGLRWNKRHEAVEGGTAQELILYLAEAVFGPGTTELP